MSEHDARAVAPGEAVCVNCSLPLTARMLGDPCFGPRHQGSPPLCGAPPSEQIYANAITCPDCLDAVRGMPRHRPVHDLRIWGPGLACPRCGQWGVDHLGFRACGEIGDRGSCAPPRYPEWPRGGLPSPRAERDYDRGNPPLCGDGPALWGLLARAMKSRKPEIPRAFCGRCRAAFGDLPRLPDRPHDARLLPAGDGAGCAACGVAAASADALGPVCDGGRVLETIAGRRAGRNRAWLAGTASRPLHARPGCGGANEYSALSFADGLARAGGRTANRARITCVPCVRALARSPALPA